MTKNTVPVSSSAQSFKPRADARVELMPPSMTMRVGNRRLTLTWRPRKALPQLLSDLLIRSWRRVLSPVLRVSVAAAAVCGAWQAPVMAAAPAPNTLPTGWSVVNGNVVFQQNGNVLNINQLTPQAIANFQSFSIGSNAVVDISQPSTAAAFLAKVTGGDISQIYGQLKAPGSVVLFNPAGIVIGAGGTVDVGRFIATTLAISDNDFLAGKLTFNKQGTAGSVENYGTIKSSTGGSVYLLGSSVTNGGVITSPQGEVILGAGETITLADTATPGVTVNVTGAAGNVTNLGEITAEAGRIGVAAGLITNSGTINASSMVKEGGRVFLRASQNLTTTATSNISADGTTGGNVTLYADNAAFLDGDISAVGTTGKGGFIETSGLKKLDVVKAPTLSAGGEWYIDPYDIEVVASTSTTNDYSTTPNISGCSTVGYAISSQVDGAKIAASTIASYLNGGSNVTLATGESGGTQGGNITVSSAILKNAGGGATLRLNANGNIAINADIGSTSGQLFLVLNTDYQSVTPISSRLVTIDNANVSTNGGTVTVLNGNSGTTKGNLTVKGADGILRTSGGSVTVNDLVINGGTVQLNGAAMTAHNVTVGGGNLWANSSSNLQISDTLDNSGNVNISGSAYTSIVNLSNAGNFTVGGGTSVNFFTITNSGNLTVGPSSSLTTNSNVVNTVNGNMTFSGVCQTASVSGAGTWTNNGNLTISGSNGFALDYEAGSFSNAGNLTINGVYQTLNNFTNTGTIKLTGGTTLLSTGSTQYGVLNIASGNEARLTDTHFNANFSAVGAGVMKWMGNVILDGAVNLAADAPELQILRGETNVQISAANSNAANTLTTRNTVYIGNSQSSTVVLNNDTTWNNYGTVNFGIDEGIATMSMGGGAKLVNQQGGILNVGSSTVGGSASTLVDNKAGGTVNLNGGMIGYNAAEAGDSSLYLNNSGTFNVSGGSVIMKNNAGAQMNVSNAVTVANLSNAGNITVAEYATLTGLLTNTGNVTVSANGTLVAGKAGSTLDNQGTLTLNSGTINSYGGIDNSGTLLGSGTINFNGDEGGMLTNSGTVSPGGNGTVGTLTLNSGKFQQTEDGKLLLDIASDESYDKILFDGSVSLNGTLQTKLLGTYVPGESVVFRPFGDASTTQGSAFRTVTGDILTSPDGSKKMVKARYDQFVGQDGEGFNYALVLKMSPSETLTSTEGSELNWGSISTWDKGYIPTAIDSVVIASSSGVYNSGSDTIDKLTLASSSSLTLNGGNLIASQIDVGNNANLYVNRNTNLTSTQLNLLAGSNMSVTNANVTTNQLSMAETSNLSMSGSNFTVNTTSQIDGIFKVTSGNLTLSGIATGAGAINIGPTNDDGGQNEGGDGGFSSFVVVNPDVIPANVTMAGADSQLGIRVREGGNLVLNGGTKIADMELTGGNVTGASGVLLTIGGNLTQESGSFNAQQLALGAGAVANVSGGNMTIDQLTTAGTSNLTQSGGNITVNTSAKIDGAVKVTTGNLTLAGSMTGNGTLSIGSANTAGAPYANVSMAGGTSNLSTTVTNGGNLSLSGTVGLGNLTMSGGTLNGTSGANLNVSSNLALASGTSLTVSNLNVTANQLSLASGANLTVSSNTVTANQLSVVDTSNLTLSGGNVTVNNSSSINGLVKVGQGNLTLNGTTTGNGGIRIATAGIGQQVTNASAPYANVSIANANSGLGVRLATGGALKVTGNATVADIEVTGGNVTASANTTLTVTATSSQSGGSVSVDKLAFGSGATATVSNGTLSANQLSLAANANLTASGGSVTTNQLSTVDTSNLTLSGGNVTVNNSSNIGGLVKVGQGNLVLNGTTTGSGGIRIATADIGQPVTNATAPYANVSIAGGTSNLGISIASGGDLLISGALRIDDMQVTGGTVRTANNAPFVVAESFAQTGGNMTLADAALSASQGNLVVGNITANNLVLEAAQGALSQTANTALHVTKELLASTRTGIALTSTSNQIAGFAANNSGTGNITLVNKLNTADTSAVTLSGIRTASGNISVDNTGGMVTAAMGTKADFLAGLPTSQGQSQTTAAALSQLGLTDIVNGRVVTGSGNVSLVTHSPLTIGAGGVSATGNIFLQAGQSTGSSSVLTVNGVVSSTGGNISLYAGDGMTINANISTSPPGVALFTLLSGAVVYASNVVVTDANGTLMPGAVIAPVTPVTPTTPGGSSATGSAVQTALASQVPEFQRTVSATELAKDKTSDGDVKQSESGNSTSGGQTQAGDKSDKKLPMCT